MMASPTAATLTPEGPPRAASPATGGGNPYTGAGDCSKDVAAFVGFVAALVTAIMLFFVLLYTVFDLVGRYRRARPGSGSGNGKISDDPENLAVEAAPTTPLPSQSQLVYSAASTKLAGSPSDCAICLAEFADGDAIRVMPACHHSFHASCIQRWLAGGRRSSCPTCRAPDAVATAAAAAGDCERHVAFVILAALHLTLMVIYLIDATVRYFLERK